MATIEQRARLVERLLEIGKREDADDKNNTDVGEASTNIPVGANNQWELVCRTEGLLSDYGWYGYFPPNGVGIDDNRVKLAFSRGPSKFQITYYKCPGTVPPANIEFFKERIQRGLDALFGPAMAVVKASDKADDADVDDDGENPVIHDPWSLQWDNVIDVIKTWEIKDFCCRNLLLGMREVNPLLKKVLYDCRSAMEFRKLRSIFACFGHDLRFGHCKLGKLYNVMVIMLKEAHCDVYLVHKVEYVNLSSWPGNTRHHIRPDYQIFRRRPTRFQDMHDWGWKKFWFAGKDSWAECLYSHANHCGWFYDHFGIVGMLIIFAASVLENLLVIYIAAQLYSLPVTWLLFREGLWEYFSGYLTVHLSVYMWIGLENLPTALVFVVCTCYHISRDFVISKSRTSQFEARVLSLSDTFGHQYINLVTVDASLLHRFAKKCESSMDIPRFPAFAELMGFFSATPGLTVTYDFCEYRVYNSPTLNPTSSGDPHASHKILKVSYFETEKTNVGDKEDANGENTPKHVLFLGIEVIEGQTCLRWLEKVEDLVPEGDYMIKCTNTLTLDGTVPGLLNLGKYILL